MKYNITFKISFYLIIVVIITGFILHFQNNPAVLIRTAISPIDDQTYNQLGLSKKLDLSEKSKIQQISFSLKINYPTDVKNINVQIPHYFTELFSSDIYLGATYKEYNNHANNQFIHEAEIIIDKGDISINEIKRILNEGDVLLGWDYKGERVQKSYNIGDTVVFIK